MSDAKKDFHAIEAAAAQGDAEAQYDLGKLYYNGSDVEKDYAQAIHWYQKAAAQGLAQAINSIGDCYFYGHGVEKNDSKAHSLYEKAAEQGLASAQSNLSMTITGVAVQRKTIPRHSTGL